MVLTVISSTCWKKPLWPHSARRLRKSSSPEPRAHVDDVVPVALHGEALGGGIGERHEHVDDVLDREEGREVQLAELLERARDVGLSVSERLRDERRVERAFIDSVSHGTHEALSAEAVVVVGFVAIAAQVHYLKRACDGVDRPLRVAEVNQRGRRRGVAGVGGGGGEPLAPVQRCAAIQLRIEGS